MKSNGDSASVARWGARGHVEYMYMIRPAPHAWFNAEEVSKCGAKLLPVVSVVEVVADQCMFNSCS